MTPPTITEIRADGDRLFATLDNADEIQLVTFRETLWRQSKVMLPPPWDERCQPWPIMSDWNDEESDLMEVRGCLHDPWAARLMAEFAAGNLANGTHRRK